MKLLAEKVVDDLLGDADVAHVATSAMNTRYSKALKLYKDAMSYTGNTRKAWAAVISGLADWNVNLDQATLDAASLGLDNSCQNRGADASKALDGVRLSAASKEAIMLLQQTMCSGMSESNDLLGDDDVASVAQSAMNTPYAEASEAYRHHYSIYKDGPEAWKHVLYEMGIWLPGESNEHRIQQLAYDLDRFLKAFKKEWKPEDLDDFVGYWLEARIRSVVDNESQLQGLCQLWRALATS